MLGATAPSNLRERSWLLAIMAVAAVVRWPVYAAPLYLDEAYTGLAARAMAEGGLPFFPSGLYYDRDVIYHALLALTFKLGGEHALLAGRSLGFVAGLALIPAVWALAKRLGAHPAQALVAAALVAIDPFTASMTPRLRMYPFLQLAGVWLIHAVHSDFMQPNSGESRFKVRTAAAVAFGLASHQLVIFFAPALAFFAMRAAWRATPQFARLPWLGFATIGLGAALPVAIARGLLFVASADPRWQGVVAWGSPAYSAPLYDSLRDASWTDLLYLKFQLSAPSRPAAVLRAIVFFAATILASARGHKAYPAARPLIAALWSAFVILVLYPRHELPTRWLVHLSPFVLTTFALACPRPVRRVPAWWALGALSLAALASAACSSPFGMLWPARYPLLSALFLWGLVLEASRYFANRLTWRAGHVDWFAPLAASAAAITIGALMSMALWWTQAGEWAETAAAVAPKIDPGDAVVVVGEDAPTVNWALPHIHAVVPTFRIEYARLPSSGKLVELASGGALVMSPQLLSALAIGHPRVWVFSKAGSLGKSYPQGDAERAWSATGPAEVFNDLQRVGPAVTLHEPTSSVPAGAKWVFVPVR